MERSRPAPPVRRSPVRAWHTLLLACAVTMAWWTVERATTSVLHPHHATMLAAAHTMERGMEAIRMEKRRLGLLQARRVDPNVTGLIGPQWSPTVTTYGDLEAKRTITNPDLAAALVAELASQGAEPGDALVTVMSGSLVGANLAVLSAARALDLRVAAVSSLGASMWGATDPEFTWLDMVAVLRREGVLDVRSSLAVLGGDMALGGGLDDDGLSALRTSARRHGVPLWEPPTLEALARDVRQRLLREVGGVERVAAYVNVGGSMLSLGLCREAASYPVGLSTRPLPCRNGQPGLMSAMSEREVPILHVLNIDALAVRYGLPLDPRPLPTPGDNRRVYGAASREELTGPPHLRPSSVHARSSWRESVVDLREVIVGISREP